MHRNSNQDLITLFYFWHFYRTTSYLKFFLLSNQDIFKKTQQGSLFLIGQLFHLVFFCQLHQTFLLAGQILFLYMVVLLIKLLVSIFKALLVPILLFYCYLFRNTLPLYALYVFYFYLYSLHYDRLVIIIRILNFLFPRMYKLQILIIPK